MFAPALAWGSTLMVGTLVGLAVLKGLIAEPLAAKLVEDHLDEAIQASILDALPFRLPRACLLAGDQMGEILSVVMSGAGVPSRR